MTKRKRWPLVLCLLTGLGAAGCTSEEEEQANSRAKEFAEDYFNLRFDEAYGNCTEDSRKWIAFRASNITEHDLEAVRSAPEGFTIEKGEVQAAAAATVVPCSISSTAGYNDYQPTPTEGDASASVIDRLNTMSANYGVTVNADGTVTASGAQ